MMSYTRIKKSNKIFFTLLMLAILYIHAEKVQASALEELNYNLVESKNPVDCEPSKYYTLFLPNKPTPGAGILIIKRMDEKFNTAPVFINKEGIIQSSDGTSDVILGMDGGYAEKFEVIIAISENENDLKPIAKCVIIPFPCIVQDDKGHKIELQAITLDGKHFSIAGSGFKPNEQITFKSRSCHESLTSTFEVDEQGNFYIFLSPAVIGKKEGPFEVTFIGKNMKPMKMRHYWGDAAFTPPNKYKTLKNKLPFPNE